MTSPPAAQVIEIHVCSSCVLQVPSDAALQIEQLPDDQREIQEMLRRHFQTMIAGAGMVQQLADVASLGDDQAGVLSELLQDLALHRQQVSARDIVGMPEEVWRCMFS